MVRGSRDVLQDPWVVVAEKGNEKSGTALAALVRALHSKQSVALILFLPRVSEKTGGNPTVCAGSPVLVSLADLPSSFLIIPDSGRLL